VFRKSWTLRLACDTREEKNEKTTTKEKFLVAKYPSFSFTLGPVTNTVENTKGIRHSTSFESFLFLCLFLFVTISPDFSSPEFFSAGINRTHHEGHTSRNVNREKENPLLETHTPTFSFLPQWPDLSHTKNQNNNRKETQKVKHRSKIPKRETTNEKRNQQHRKQNETEANRFPDPTGKFEVVVEGAHSPP
jgi:hypothetical protein